jgi:hypothetical protein
MAVGNIRAERTYAKWPKARGNTIAQINGHRYEARVEKQLTAHVKAGRLHSVERNPWFEFHDDFGSANCSPDFLIWPSPLEQEVFIVEVKLTWVEIAAHKLIDLYHPVITRALNVRATPLIICRNLTPRAPKAERTLRDAIRSDYRLLHWPDVGNIPW